MNPALHCETGNNGQRSDVIRSCAVQDYFNVYRYMPIYMIWNGSTSVEKKRSGGCETGYCLLDLCPLYKQYSGRCMYSEVWIDVGRAGNKVLFVNVLKKNRVVHSSCFKADFT